MSGSIPDIETPQPQAAPEPNAAQEAAIATESTSQVTPEVSQVAPATGGTRRKRQSTGRFKTGLVFSVVVLACLLASDISTVALVVALAALCSFELFALLRSDAKLPNEWIGVTGSALYPVMYVWLNIEGILLLTLILTVIIMVWYVFSPQARVTDAAVTVFGALYTGLMLTSMVIIRTSIDGIWGGFLAVAVVFSVWANDTMAYVWGSRLGSHKMAPRISPKKSWEGCVAGLVGSVVIWMAVPFIPGVSIPFAGAVVCGVVSGVFSVLGDLAESRVKRAAGKKDSGTLLPGHGGFLDRCDALIMGSAASAMCLIIAGVVVF